MSDRAPVKTNWLTSFRYAIWLTPIVYAMHIGEESLGFVPWVNTYFSPHFTLDQFVRNNAVFMGITLLYCVGLSLYPKKWLALLFYSHLSSLMFFNALFHLGATAYFSAYSPGAVTAAALYLPSWYFLTSLGRRQGFLPGVPAALFWVLGGVLHAAVIYTQLISPSGG